MACVTQGLDKLLLLALQCINLPSFSEQRKIWTERVLLSPVVKPWIWYLNSFGQAVLRCTEEVGYHEKGWTRQKTLWL